MSVIVTVLFWSIFATVLACMEIESEGRKGWAENAPTWYRVTPWYARAYGLVMGKKPLTGYHLFTFFMPFLLFHAHFAMGMEWSVERELLALAMYFSVCPLWDYHWFVLNPWYRGKFTQKDIWWHAQSYWVFGRFPVDYLIGFGLSVLLAGAAAWLAADAWLIQKHLLTLLGFAIFTALLHLVAPLYRKWYWHMRRKGTDERKLVNIFHTPAPPEITKELLVNTEHIR
jgi:heme/copper-type cytochrome/quinol oxidase subunit 4